MVHFSHETHLEEMERLEKEQEQLNSSLLALTTHFAQVQFRLKQIVSAEAEDKEVGPLLKQQLYRSKKSTCLMNACALFILHFSNILENE